MMVTAENNKLKLLTLVILSFFIDIVILKVYVFTFFILPICIAFNILLWFIYKNKKNLHTCLFSLILITFLFSSAQIHEYLLMNGISKLASEINQVKTKEGKYPPSNLKIRIWGYNVNYININKEYSNPFIYFQKNGFKHQYYDLVTNKFSEERED